MGPRLYHISEMDEARHFKFGSQIDGGKYSHVSMCDRLPIKGVCSWQVTSIIFGKQVTVSPKQKAYMYMACNLSAVSKLRTSQGHRQSCTQ